MYASKYSTYLAYPANTRASDVVEIDIDGLPPNIIFSISRSVYYERNDGNRARVRICDNVGNLGSPLSPSSGAGSEFELPSSLVL